MTQDPRIVMVSTYRPPLPRRRRSPWPGRLLTVLVVLVLTAAGTVAGLELYLGSDPHLPRLDRAADYHPRALTPIESDSGEWIGELVGERRTVTENIPQSLRAEMVAKKDPDFFARGRLGQLDFVVALWRRLRGQPERPGLRLALARSLAADLDDVGIERFIKEWVVALRLARRLSREETLTMYLNQVPFGAGVFGVVEGERALGRERLVEWAESTREIPLPPPPTSPAPEYAAAVARELRDRFDADALARLGQTVTTACDLALTGKIREIVKKQPGASVVVEEAGTHAVRTLIGDGKSAPLGGMRALLVVAAALQSQTWTAASKLGSERLRPLATKNPVAAASALVEGGLPASLVRAIGIDAGVGNSVTGSALVSGQARLTARELASVLATFASAGLRRQPQLILKIGKEPESESRRASLAAVPPEVAWLTSSLLPLQKRAAGLAVSDGERGSWFGAFTAERAVVLHVPADARVALKLGTQILALALRGVAPRPWPRPPSLVTRHLDGEGNPLPSKATSGAEEFFLPGSLPREDVLPPE